MKEKIKELSKGNFEYEMPGLVLSVELMELSIEAGSTGTGTFIIKNSRNTPVRGLVYSDNRLLSFRESSFSETENLLSCEFASGSLKPGETMKGIITVVSDCGEKEIPFSVHAELPFCETSIGKIRDLFHFANLAKKDWIEAVKLFRSERFEQVILKQDMKESMIYHNLIKSVSTSQAMEEFLIAVHKKLKINFLIDKQEFNFQTAKETVMDRIIITKDSWGYGEIKISSDANFLVPDHKIIWTDNFIGSRYALDFVVEPKYMRTGKNYGRIFIKTPFRTFTVEVTAERARPEGLAEDKNRKKLMCWVGLIQSYLRFRMNQISARQYVGRTEALVRSLSAGSSADLVKAHIATVEGKKDQARELLDRIAADRREEDLNVQDYSAWLYLNALCSKSPEDISEACEKITGFYNQGYRDWKILWYLLYLDKRYDRNRKQKLKDILEHLRQGCHSPVLYLEAAAIYNEEAALLTELDEAAIQVVNWAIKSDYLNKEAAAQYIYLAGRKKSFHRLVYRGLERLYDKYKSKDILAAVLRILIKGRKTGPKYLPWYRAGVEEQLRITELNEYYMYSVDEDVRLELPQPLLRYFVFNSSLEDRKKAFLYAGIISRKEQYPVIYDNYLKIIDRFAGKQLAEGTINESLSVIYEDMVIRGVMDPEMAQLLPDVMFRYELYCENTDITGVYVVHKELKQEQYSPIENGRSQLSIFTENAQIFLADSKDNRYFCSVDYTLHKLFHLEEYVERCYEFSARNLKLLLHLAEQIDNYHKTNDNAAAIQRRLIDNAEITEYYRGKWSVSLIHIYYDKFENERLEEILGNVNLAAVSAAERSELIELMIVRDMYEKAMEQLAIYGYERISVKRLLRLWTRFAVHLGIEEKSESLILLGAFIFKAGKYNETLLRYLVRYFDGTTGDMYELWKAANGFEIDTVELEERLLAQMLFAESGGAHAFPVFFSYYRHGSNRKLIRAFLGCNSYKYLVNERVIPPGLFDIIRRESVFEENETGMLALLKFYGNKGILTAEEEKLVDFNMSRFVDRGIILPFFKDFKGRVAIPYCIANKEFVEYKTNPDHMVTLHYRLENEDNHEDYISVPMQNVYGGIFVREFVLFYNETLQYYITEQNGDGDNIMISKTLSSNNRPEDEETKYSLLNLMLMTRELQDEKTLLELMENYVKTEYALQALFRPL